ncbi:MAG: glycosyltransferase family 4 protein [Bacteroidota bacterium]
MKVAIVLNTSWNVYNFRMGLIKALQSNGIAVTVIAPKDRYSEKLIENDCEYIEVKMDSRGVNPIKDLALVAELYGIYKRIKPDVILHYTIKPNIYGTIAASLLRIPVINNVCGLGTVFLKDSVFSRIAILMYRFAFKFPKLIFFQNDDDRKLFSKKKIIRKTAVETLPGSGIDLSRFSPAPFKRNERFTFLLVSRLIHDKGIIEYIDAVKKLKANGFQGKFQLLGAKDPKHKRGIPEEVINEWLENNVIEYLGTTDDVRPFIKDADCVVLPSYREGTPRTLLEAASVAKPIVATDVPGCNNVVKDDFNGFLCQLRDSDDLANKMFKMASLQDQQLERFGNNGRKLVESKFDENIVVSKYLQAISDIKLNSKSLN